MILKGCFLAFSSAKLLIKSLKSNEHRTLSSMDKRKSAQIWFCRAIRFYPLQLFYIKRLIKANIKPFYQKQVKTCVQDLIPRSAPIMMAQASLCNNTFHRSHRFFGFSQGSATCGSFDSFYNTFLKECVNQVRALKFGSLPLIEGKEFFLYFRDYV